MRATLVGLAMPRAEFVAIFKAVTNGHGYGVQEIEGWTWGALAENVKQEAVQALQQALARDVVVFAIELWPQGRTFDVTATRTHVPPTRADQDLSAEAREEIADWTRGNISDLLEAAYELGWDLVRNQAWQQEQPKPQASRSTAPVVVRRRPRS